MYEELNLDRTKVVEGRLRRIVFVSIVFGTGSMAAVLFVLPLLYEQILTLHSHIHTDVHFCKMRTRELWQTTIRHSERGAVRPKRQATPSSNWLFGRWVGDPSENQFSFNNPDDKRPARAGALPSTPEAVPQPFYNKVDDNKPSYGNQRPPAPYRPDVLAEPGTIPDNFFQGAQNAIHPSGLFKGSTVQAPAPSPLAPAPLGPSQSQPQSQPAVLPRAPAAAAQVPAGEGYFQTNNERTDDASRVFSPSQRVLAPAPRPSQSTPDKNVFSPSQRVLAPASRPSPSTPDKMASQKKCRRGAPGPAGRPGAPGKDAQNGADGKDGRPGSSAPLKAPTPNSYGLQACQQLCPPGAPGPAGSAGDKGPKGRKGPNGAPGQSPPPAYEGPPGLPGQKGAPGAPGAPGERGDPGTLIFDEYTRGLPGPAGPVGPSGSNGDRGLPGLDGKPGTPATQGPPGDPGAPGRPGRNGEDGSAGTKGPDGAVGSCDHCPPPRVPNGY